MSARSQDEVGVLVAASIRHEQKLAELKEENSRLTARLSFSQNQLAACQEYTISLEEHYQKKKRVFEQMELDKMQLLALVAQNKASERALLQEVDRLKQEVSQVSKYHRPYRP